MKKIIGLFSGLLVAGSLITATPAHAAPVWNTAYACVTESGVRSCVSPSWTKQADGTGVRLEGVRGATPINCATLEPEGGRYNPVRPAWVDPSNQRVDYQYDFGAEGCEFSKNLSNAGSDRGAMDFRYVAKARVDLGGDHWIYMGWTLRPNGTSTLNYSFIVEV